jgi:hypothetical protein
VTHESTAVACAATVARRDTALDPYALSFKKHPAILTASTLVAILTGSRPGAAGAV